MRVRILKWLAVGVLIVGIFTGCGEKAEKESQPDQPKISVGVVYDTGGRGDMAFNDGAANGVIRGEKEFGIKVYHLESRTPNDFEPNLLSLIEQNVDMIVAIGSNQKGAVQKVAKENPHTKFVFIDEFLKGDNIRSITFKEHEGSFLVGYAAGLMSKAKKVAFVAGMQVPVSLKCLAGYTAGVKTANSAIKVLPPRYLGSWSDVSVGQAAANVLLGDGADVIYQVAAKAGLSVLKAASDHKKYGIGVDSDQDHLYPGYVLTSMIKRVDNVVYESVKDLVRGEFSFGNLEYGIKEGGIDISPMKYTKTKFGDPNIKRLYTIRQQIIDGVIKVPASESELQEYLKSASSHSG